MSDHVQMPHFDMFKDAVSYYSTLAHEFTHWTSPAGRCDRVLGKRFGDNAYAAEELIAELGAAFVCAQLGLSSEPREDHAQYILSWLKVLKADNKAIFTAASKAQQAADFLVKASSAKVGAVEETEVIAA
jgi:antirestriction protein ArdC